MMSEEEKLIKFKEVFNFLLEKATNDYSVKSVMAVNGYNYDEITMADVEKFKEYWEKEDLASYTEHKINQGTSYCSNCMLNYMMSGNYAEKTFTSENDEALFKYYEEKVLSELMKKFFPDKYNLENENFNRIFFFNFLRECNNYLNKSTLLLSGTQNDKYVETIGELFYENKEHFEKLPGYKENPESVQEIISIINQCLSFNHVQFPGESYFKIYDGEKEVGVEQITRTSPEFKDVVESINILKDLGIVLTEEQERLLNTPISISKEEIEKNVQLAIEKNMKLNEERLAWQNDPNHPDNVRLKSMRTANLIVEKLTKLDEFGMLSKEQIEQLNEYKDFIKYSRDVMEQHPEGMSEEVRQEMQNFYAEQQRVQEEEARYY